MKRDPGFEIEIILTLISLRMTSIMLPITMRKSKTFQGSLKYPYTGQGAGWGWAGEGERGRLERLEAAQGKNMTGVIQKILKPKPKASESLLYL